MKGLVDQRNIIAHNPLSFDVYESEKGEMEFMEAVKSLKNGDKRLHYSDLLILKDELVSLTDEVGEVLVRLTKKA